MEHPSNPEFQPIESINCKHCMTAHPLEDINPLVMTYSEEPNFTHFAFYCGDNLARMFEVPAKIIQDLMASNVPVATAEFPNQDVVTAYQLATGVDYEPADASILRQTLAFSDDLDEVEVLEDIDDWGEEW